MKRAVRIAVAVTVGAALAVCAAGAWLVTGSPPAPPTPDADLATLVDVGSDVELIVVDVVPARVDPFSGRTPVVGWVRARFDASCANEEAVELWATAPAPLATAVPATAAGVVRSRPEELHSETWMTATGSGPELRSRWVNGNHFVAIGDSGWRHDPTAGAVSPTHAGSLAGYRGGRSWCETFRFRIPALSAGATPFEVSAASDFGAGQAAAVQAADVEEGVRRLVVPVEAGRARKIFSADAARYASDVLELRGRAVATYRGDSGVDAAAITADLLEVYELHAVVDAAGDLVRFEVRAPFELDSDAAGLLLAAAWLSPAEPVGELELPAPLVTVADARTGVCRWFPGRCPFGT